MIINENDPRVKRSKQLIKDAFTKLMMERDFESITVKDITELATINRATFYAHYEDKYQLLETLFLELFNQTLAERNIEHNPFNLETLEKLILALCDYFKRIKMGCKKITSSVMSLMEEKIICRLTTLIKELVKHSTDKKNVITEDIELSIIMVSWSIYGVALHWNSDKRTSQELLAASSAKLIQNGYGDVLFSIGTFA
ncbi:TetR family transcriptional regulator [Paenibacillus wynnii]|uniref:TetR family transcriptional regulator n=1 Tax=Paenibacillus wynnii TaxID=268407 RepID=UPI002791D40A|nr:TetR family transcriptional regulator [Paenibacillus wynnii]MDQ0195320.1 AcrR family transcriptional regulator [Paenibacillus wynnii]